jgi:hypothetical protein
MRLVDLNPTWYGAGGEGISNADGTPVPERRGVGIIFDCPCGCGELCAIPFANALDGGPQYDQRQGWQREGDTFETLTLRPSILRTKPPGCGWHGWITNGEVTSC